MMHKMNKVISAAEWDVAGGREQGGSLYAWAEKSSALRASAARVRAQLLLGVKGTPAGWTDSRNLTKPIVSNKDIQIGRWQIPFRSCWTHFTHSNFALVCIMCPISLVKTVIYQSLFCFCFGVWNQHFHRGRIYFLIISWYQNLTLIQIFIVM